MSSLAHGARLCKGNFKDYQRPDARVREALYSDSGVLGHSTTPHEEATGFEPAFPDLELNVSYAGEDAPGPIAIDANAMMPCPA